MKIVKNYIAHAEECEKLAKTARTPDEKKMITDMAATWRMLAARQRMKLDKAEPAILGREPADGDGKLS